MRSASSLRIRSALELNMVSIIRREWKMGLQRRTNVVARRVIGCDRFVCSLFA
jgi:hypothetical protein